ncbi:MAG TPA: GNAT family N-acetyltransferase [Planctomycetota bacterium]|nr:GNAT family N-acetyltransferase [Planctomycetota bacterium]
MAAGPLVREASRDDAEAIAAMYQQTWPLHWETPECVRRQFDKLDPIGGTVLIAVEQARVIGHCEFIPTREPEPRGFWGFLEALEVHRDFRRRGIGTALVREAIRRCAALGCTRFGSSPDDERSEGLYLTCGMSRVERSVCTTFAVVGDLPEPLADAVLPLPPAARPWEGLLHVLGRFSCLPYLWSVTFNRKARGEPGYESAFAERLRWGGQDAAVFFTGSWLHVLVPPDRREDAELIRRAVAYGAGRIQALGRDSFSTLLPLPLADDVRAVRGIYPSESHFHFHMWMPLKEG